MNTSIIEKMNNAKESSWLSEYLTPEESIIAKYIAHIAATIQRQRKAKGLTQLELAKMLGVSQVMVSRWENGEENFTVATLVKISSALGLDLYNPIEDSSSQHLSNLSLQHNLT